mmetsp:Transcript_16865/g.34718  ORF Transcript_16865/g.34718 Transcript_16865/m.34718 type:complete len:121 (-) Transcript_16865:391-753(-)
MMKSNRQNRCKGEEDWRFQNSRPIQHSLENRGFKSNQSRAIFHSIIPSKKPRCAAASIIQSRETSENHPPVFRCVTTGFRVIPTIPVAFRPNHLGRLNTSTFRDNLRTKETELCKFCALT